MSIRTNTNVSPYYDDFDQRKNYYRVMFKPGYPIQARELTQLQTIIGDQLEKLSSVYLKTGQTVIPGEYNININAPYVRLSSITQGSKAKDFIGYTVTGVTSGVKAVVTFAEEVVTREQETEGLEIADATFYLEYTSSGTSSEYETFIEGETLESTHPDFYTATVGITGISAPLDSKATGKGSLFVVKEGYYYIDGTVVRSGDQTITLDKYGQKPTYKVGFNVEEDFINSNEDESLKDNAQGHSNFAAPGADRLKISLVLTKQNSEEFDPYFVYLVDVISGNIVGAANNTNRFAWLQALLAKRTFDESGDYIISDFPIKPMEYWNNAIIDDEEVNVGGLFDPDRDGFYNPIPGSGETQTLTFEEADDNYVISVNPGEAYVQGYNVGYRNPVYVFGKKSREENLIPNTFTQINPGINVPISNMSGLPDIENIRKNNISADAFTTIATYRNFIDGFTSEAERLGRSLNAGERPWKTYHILTDNAIGVATTTSADDIVEVEILDGETNTLKDTGTVVYPFTTTTTLNIGTSVVLNLTSDNTIIKRGDKIRVKSDDDTTGGATGTTGATGLPSTDARVLICVEMDPVRTGVMTPKYLQPKNLINTVDGYYSNLSSFRLGVSSSEFFTELAVEDLTPGKEWEVNGMVRGEQSEALGKIEQGTDDNLLIVSNILGEFANGETVTQFTTQDLRVSKKLPDSSGAEYDVINAVSGDITIDIGDELDDCTAIQFVSGTGTITIQDALGTTGATGSVGKKDAYYRILSARQETAGQIIVTVDASIVPVTTGGKVILQGLYYTCLTTMADMPPIKQGRIFISGEAVKFYFNDYLNDSRPDGNSGEGGGGDASNNGSGDPNNRVIFTPDVQLVYETVLRNIRSYPNPDGLSTQEEANNWFYDAIKELQANNVNEKIYLQQNPPAIATDGDIWIQNDGYDMFVWDGTALSWVGLNESSNNPADVGYNLNITVDSSIAGAISPTQNSVAPFAFRTPDNYDLSGVKYIIVSALGTAITLYGINSENVPLDSTSGAAVPDFYYDDDRNDIVLTRNGRSRVTNFPYFVTEDNVEENPRVNFEVTAHYNDDPTVEYIRGYTFLAPFIITNTINKTKALYSDLIDPTGAKFSANISLQESEDTDVTSVADGALFSGFAGRNFLKCDNFSGDTSEQLITGDIVTFTNDNGQVEQKVVLFATQPYGFGSSRSSSIIYFTTNILGNVTGKVVQRLRLKEDGDPNEKLLYELPASVISGLETDPNITGISYEVFREFATSIDRNATELTISTSKTNEEFLSRPGQIMIVCDTVTDGTNEEVDANTGRLLRLSDSGSITIGDSGRKITITLEEPCATEMDLKVILPVKVNDAKARRKILRRNVQLRVTYNENFKQDPVLSPASQRAIDLKNTDIFRINSIMMEYDGGEIDVTKNYIFDNGQRDNIYALGQLIRELNAPAPSGDLIINYDYFEHDGDGDFFSVDSYTHDDGIDYSQIPAYSPDAGSSSNPVLDKDSNIFIPLRDCADFRPSVNSLVNEDGTGTPSYIPLLTPDRSTETSVNFLESKNGGDGTVSRIPIPGSQFRCDIQHYLPKIDTLFLDKTGKMTISHGLPAENPTAPPEISNGIKLYDLYIPAYTFNISDIVVKKYNYRRYTMKDISRIDKKLTKVQNLVSLSLLEQEAVSLSVRDAVTGLERFKNGIVVDAFRDHSKGDVGQDQYRNSVDPKYDHLRPPFVRDQIELEEQYQYDENRLRFGGYRNNAGIITCDYNNVDFIIQPSATRWINLQPYSVFTYEGVMVLDPEVDTFEDVTVLPDLVIEDNSVWDAMENLNELLEAAGLGTVWGDWETTSTTRETINSRGRSRPRNTDGSGGRSRSLAPGSTLITTEQIREGLTLDFDPETASTNETSYGERVVDVKLARTMRTIPVNVFANRLKPNTRYYAFFDGVNVSDWFDPTAISTTLEYTDNVNRFDIPLTNVRPIPGGAPIADDGIGFGSPIISDDTGAVTGVFLIPNGRPPIKGSKFTGNLEDVQYQQSGPSRSFATGQRLFVLTSSVDNASDLDLVEGIAKKEFMASGILLDKQETIVSTRIPETKTITDERTIYEVIPPPSPPDPIAQSFDVETNFESGVFVSEIDIFFRTKDANQGCELYLVTTDQEYPTDKILPHSRVTKNANSIIRLICDLGTLSTVTLPAGLVLQGQESGATATVLATSRFNSAGVDSVVNVSNTVYNVVLDNYMGEFLPGEEVVPQGGAVVEGDSLIIVPEEATFTIVQDEVIPSRVDIKSLGKDYTLAGSKVEFSTPELPGGRTATGEIKVSQSTVTNSIDEEITGLVYEVKILDPGSGYIKTPSAQLVGDGTGCLLDVRVREGIKAVDMGVTVSDDATLATTFKFEAPVYLIGGATYAIVVKSPNSLEYTAWTSKLGENQIGTDRRVVAQPNLGSLFMSQNGRLWTEDQSMDLKFSLRRCEFKANNTCEMSMFNKPISKRICPDDCIEVSAGTDFIPTDPESDEFGVNLKVVKITHPNHGLVKGDLVALSGVVGDPGTIPNDSFNTLHQVVDALLDTFTIKVDYDENEITPISVKAGGPNVMCSYNRPYETINLYSGLMSFPDTDIIARNRPTQHAGVTLYNTTNQYVLGELGQIPIMDTFYYNGAKQVANYLNEAKYNDTFKLNGRTSMETRFRFSTSNSAISPVIDLQRTNMNIIHNLIDAPTEEEVDGARTASVTFNSSTREFGLQRGSRVGFTGTDGLMKYVTVSDINHSSNTIEFYGGRELYQLTKSSTFNVDVMNDGDFEEMSVKTSRDFLKETHRYGTTYAKWLSRTFFFEDECDGLEVRLRAVFYGATDITAYYSPRSVGTVSGSTEDTTWIPFNINSTNPNTGEIYPALPDNVLTIKPRNPEDVDHRLFNALEYQTLVWSAQDLAKFEGVAIKIVMRQQNPALAPIIDDMVLLVSE